MKKQVNYDRFMLKWSIRAKKWSIRAEPIDFYKLICYVTSENVSFMTLKLSFMTCLEKRKLISYKLISQRGDIQPQ